MEGVRRLAAERGDEAAAGAAAGAAVGAAADVEGAAAVLLPLHRLPPGPLTKPGKGRVDHVVPLHLVLLHVLLPLQHSAGAGAGAAVAGGGCGGAAGGGGGGGAAAAAAAAGGGGGGAGGSCFRGWG